jgi:hypothetical protein
MAVTKFGVSVTAIDPAKKKAPDLADRGLKVGRNARKL